MQIFRKLCIVSSALLIPLIVASCETTSGGDVVGSGPIELTPRQAKNFENWRTSTYPGGLFFLTPNGGSYWVYCKGANAAQCSFDITEWHYNCEKRFGSCKLYGMLDAVVWRHDKPAR